MVCMVAGTRTGLLMVLTATANTSNVRWRQSVSVCINNISPRIDSRPISRIANHALMMLMCMFRIVVIRVVMQRLQLAHCRALAWTDVLQLLRAMVARRTGAANRRERCRVAVPVQRRRSIPSWTTLL